MASIDSQGFSFENNAIHCTGCYSTNFIFKGNASTKSRGQVPRYLCKECGKNFRYGPFVGSKYSERDICELLDRCARRWSFCEVSEEFGIAKSEVIRIIEKYTTYLSHYESAWNPKIGLNLELDDMYFQLTDLSIPVKELVPSPNVDGLRIVRELEQATHGRTFDEIRNYEITPSTATQKVIVEREVTVTNIIDCGNPYFITTEAGRSHKSHSLKSPDDFERLRAALTRATQIIGKTQEIRIITTDGLLTTYDPAIRLFPIFEHRFQTKEENPAIVNNCESLNRTVRRHVGIWVRFRTVKSLQIMLEFFRLYYNFIRIHGAILKTPAEGAGYPPLTGNNIEKWFTTINIGYQYYLKSKIEHAQRIYGRQRLDNRFD